MEVVRLEVVAACAMTADAVIQLVQTLKDVPPSAICEIEEIRARSVTTRTSAAEQALTESTVLLHCEPRVAAFLCQRFSQDTRHITQGELVTVRCRRVLGDRSASTRLGSKLVPLWPTYEDPASNQSPPDSNQDSKQVDVSSSTPPKELAALPVEKVIAIIDVLGDQVVDAHAAYELHAERDVTPPHRLTLLGMSKAMVSLCEKETILKQVNNARQGQRRGESPSSFATVSNLRSLLERLIVSEGVAVRKLPPSPTAPFLSYTDFLACYVALLSIIHSSTAR